MMRKGQAGVFDKFKDVFDRVNAATGKKQFMIPYFISNFPGCTERHMRVVDGYLAKYHWSTKQVQDFIPLAMTMGCAMYCSETTPDGQPIQVNKGLAERRGQRDLLRRTRDGAGRHGGKNGPDGPHGPNPHGRNPHGSNPHGRGRRPKSGQ